MRGRKDGGEGDVAMSDELTAELPEFKKATESINSTLDTLGGKGGNIGRGFTDFQLTPKDAGKEEAQKSSEEFAERWSWGVRNMCQSANNIAQALDLSAGLYHRMDEQANTMFKTVWTNTMGNPHLTSEEIGERDWGDTLADNPVNNQLNPDLSEESRQHMMDNLDTNGQIVEEVGPQALANVGATSQTPYGYGTVPQTADTTGDALPAPSFNSGAAERAAEIDQANENPNRAW